MVSSSSTRRFPPSTQCAILIALIAVLITRPVFAQGSPPTDDQVNRIAKQLYCPVCESTPLDVCPTEACRQWRDLIREMLTDGKSEAEIKQYFVEHYGPQVLNEPPNRLLTYTVPILSFLLGAFLLLRGFQWWIKSSSTASSTSVEVAGTAPDPYITKLEEELKKRN